MLPTGIKEFMLPGWYVITGTFGFVYNTSINISFTATA